MGPKGVSVQAVALLCLAAAIVFAAASWSPRSAGDPRVASLTAEVLELQRQLRKRDAEVVALLKARMGSVASGAAGPRSEVLDEPPKSDVAARVPAGAALGAATPPLRPDAIVPAGVPSLGLAPAGTDVPGAAVASSPAESMPVPQVTLPAATTAGTTRSQLVPVATTRPRAVPAPAGSPSLAGGKISPSSTVTACTGALPEPANTEVTFIVQNPRTGSMFMSGRLQQYGSGRFTFKWVRAKTLKPRPFGSAATPADWLQHACSEIPGYKVVVYDSGASPNWWLSNWPPNTVLVMTGDEMGRWGLYSKQRYWGPFGTDRESFFEENVTSPHRHILLPPTIRPWFRQYYDARQVESFGNDAVFIPLGSRVEFPDIAPEQIAPASTRGLVYTLMMALTDHSRVRLRDALKNTVGIPESRSFVHIAEQWHPELTNEEYINPEEYAKHLLNAVFTPCPKGRSLDTFRMYEAMEAGSIPIVELSNGYAKAHLPPDFFESPILFVESWEDAPAAMLALLKDPVALDNRQRDVTAWYRALMTRTVSSIERLLLSRRPLCYTPQRDKDCAGFS